MELLLHQDKQKEKKTGREFKRNTIQGAEMLLRAQKSPSPPARGVSNSSRIEINTDQTLY